MSSIRRRGDGLVWRLRPAELLLLVDLLEQLDEAIDGPTDDPVVQRLFPAPLEDDEDDDEALRTIIAGDLLLRRHEAIRAVLAILRRHEVEPDAIRDVRVRLVDDEPGMMLAVLNDVRLALGSRVGMTAVELRQLVDEDDDRTRALLDIMDVLAWFQMQLLAHIDPAAARYDDPDTITD